MVPLRQQPNNSQLRVVVAAVCTRVQLLVQTPQLTPTHCRSLIAIDAYHLAVSNVFNPRRAIGLRAIAARERILFRCWRLVPDSLNDVRCPGAETSIAIRGERCEKWEKLA